MLVPQLQLQSLSKVADSLQVVDITGNYSSPSNTGGFGTPNPLKSDVTGVILNLYTFSKPTTYMPYRLPNTTGIFGTGQVLLPTNFSIGMVFPDGVLGFKYEVLFAGTGDITYVGGSKQFFLTNADTIFADAVGFVLTGINNSTIYYIDTTKALTGTSGWVTTSLPSGNNTQAFELFYEGDLKFLVDKFGNNCLIEDTAIWADNGCKDAHFRDVDKRILMQIAMRNKFTQGYFIGANQLAIALAQYCECVKALPCNC